MKRERSTRHVDADKARRLRGRHHGCGVVIAEGWDLGALEVRPSYQFLLGYRIRRLVQLTAAAA